MKFTKPEQHLRNTKYPETYKDILTEEHYPFEFLRSIKGGRKGMLKYVQQKHYDCNGSNEKIFNLITI